MHSYRGQLRGLTVHNTYYGNTDFTGQTWKIFSSFFSLLLFPLISMCFQTINGFQDVYSHSWVHAGCLVTRGVSTAAQHLCQEVLPFLTLNIIITRDSWDFLIIKMFLSFYIYVHIDFWIFIYKNKDVRLLLQPQLMKQNRNIHQRKRGEWQRECKG